MSLQPRFARRRKDASSVLHLSSMSMVHSGSMGTETVLRRYECSEQSLLSSH